MEVPVRRSTSDRWKLWITRGERWVTTMTRGVGQRQLLKVTNISTHTLILHDDTKIGMWLSKDQIPRAQGFVSVGSRRYAEWLTLAYEATTDQVDAQVDLMEEYKGPLLETSQYKTLSSILKRPKRPAPVMGVSRQLPSEEADPPLEEKVFLSDGASQEQREPKEGPPGEEKVNEEEAESDDLQQADDQVCTFESGNIWAGDINQGWAIIPEVDPVLETI